MALFKLQGKEERLKGIYYEFDTEDAPIGEGGMGKVYRGRCVNEKNGQSKFVAVKFIDGEASESRYVIEKARREAAMQFKHVNLVEMLGFIETENIILGKVSYHYHVVSELLTGVSLDGLLEGRTIDQDGHSVPYAEKLFKAYKDDNSTFAITIAKNILSGLMCMHDEGYIHRDIDPTNIMITSNGHIKLIDYGIAKKMVSLTSNDKHLTVVGQFIGKPEYAAPELVRGEIDKQNQTTDIYAVGILLFQCIVGRPPFVGDRAHVLNMQQTKKPPLKLIKNRELREVVKKAMAKDIADRYQSTAEFRYALDRINLNKPNSNLKSIFASVIIAATVLISVVLAVIHYRNGGNYPPIPDEENKKTVSIEKETGDIEQERVTLSYNDALKLIKKKEAKSVKEGLEMLNRLSDNGDAKATYLLSRLYFKSKLENEYIEDWIKEIQKNAKVEINNTTAHKFLMKAYEQDSTDYHILYEVGCEFWKLDQRTDAEQIARYSKDKKCVEESRIKAIGFFKKAEMYAKKANDSIYLELLSQRFNKIRTWCKDNKINI